MSHEFKDFNIEKGVQKVWNRKWLIIIACIAAAVLAFVISSQKKPEFKSVSAFIPPDMSSLNSMVYNNGISYRGFESAEEEDVDRTIDYLSSTHITDSIVGLFDLYEHYGLKKGEKNVDKTLYFQFSKKNKISFSNKSTVTIQCWDTEPELAAKIAQTYLSIGSEFFENISQRKRGFEATLQERKRVMAERLIMVDSLASLRTQYKLYHVDHVGDKVDAIIAAGIKSNPNFNKFYDNMLSLELQLNNTEDRISDIEREYSSRKLNLDQYPSLIQVTQFPTISTFKDRPKRSIYVAFAFIGMFIFASFAVVYWDN